MDVGRADINNLLAQMRELKTELQTPSQRVAAPNELTVGRGNEVGVPTGETPSFSQMFQQAVDTVNETQHMSSALSKAYTKGEPGVSLAQVMVASQKAGVSFDALTEVRNKLVEAYQDVMNMPI